MESNHCTIYTSANLPIDGLMTKMAAFLKSEIKAVSFIETADLSLSIRKNDEFNHVLEKSFPDGFLYFKYIIDIDFPDDLSINYIKEVDKILNWLWDKKYPSVASCNYEYNLTGNGGYNNPNVPWVS